MQISEYKDRHYINSHYIFIAKDELKPETFAGNFVNFLIGLGYWYDFDFIMVN